MRILSYFLLIFVLIALPFPSQSLHAQETSLFNPAFLLSDEEMLDSSSMDEAQIQAFLSRGSLVTYRARDVDGKERSAAEMIERAAVTFGLNPKFLLTLLQREQSLVEDDTPSQDQMDWAMGYAICDDCSKDDPRLQKFRGFAAQVYYASQRIRESYLYDLARRGYTETGAGPGRESVIDGTRVVPVNNATASLYTYTPHMHGNENFVAVWTRWFASAFLTGTLLQDKTSGAIWLIQYGLRRPITSRATFFSRFNPDTILAIAPDVLESYPVGRAITFPNYSLLRSPRGTVYLLVDDTRRGFTSQEAFRASGFVSDEIVDVTFADLAPYAEGTPITTSTVKPQGALLQDKTSGGVFLVQDGAKHPIISREILMSRFANQPIIPVSPEELDVYTREESVTFQDGTLVAVRGSADVFVITEGMRRHIADEATFLTYGWDWGQVIWTDERSVLLQPLADPLTTVLETPEIEIATQTP